MASEESKRKLEKLKDILLDMESVVVAFSGGVDSTFLLAKAMEVLGPEKVLAVIATSSTYVQREFQAAESFCRDRSIPYKVITSEELDIPEFRGNPTNRCYHCKRELFGHMKQEAYQAGLCAVVDGTNADDLKDFRPGRKALEELFIVSPLMQAGLTKDEIREFSKEMGLPTWNKAAAACLASRFPYGNEITKDKLNALEKAEDFLVSKGFHTLRVRHHGEIARIELGESEIPKMADATLRKEITEAFKDLGFTYVSLDLQGYRTGSMNETLAEKEKEIGQAVTQ